MPPPSSPRPAPLLQPHIIPSPFMDLPEDLKILFLPWLEDEAIRLALAGSKMGSTFTRAAENLRRHPDPIQTRALLLQVKGVGPKIVQMLGAKLSEHCRSTGISELPLFLLEGSLAAPQKRRHSDVETAINQSFEAPPTPKKARKARTYIPKQRSGGYAILLALLKFDPHHQGMLREEIARRASPFCSNTFETNASTKEFYTAWTSMKTLLGKGLVESTGRPVQYTLSLEGRDLAVSLAQASGVAVPEVATAAETRHSLAGGTPDKPDKPDTLGETGEPRTHNGTPSITNQLLRSEAALLTNETSETSLWNSNDYRIKLLVDNREIRSVNQRDYFTKKLKELSVHCDPAQLSVGDCLWVAEHKTSGETCVLDFILERKRLDDLALSIRDGRFTEQKARLKRTGIRNCFYLVEELAGIHVALMLEAIQTAIAVTVTTSRFFVKRSKDADDTIWFLARLTRTIETTYAGKSLVVLRPSNIDSQTKYQEILATCRTAHPDAACVYNYDVFLAVMAKSDLTTVRTMFIRMLMTIRGVSLAKAVVIQRRFETPRRLLEFFHTEHRDQPESAKPLLFAAVFRGEVAGNKIGPALAVRIYETWGRAGYGA